MARPDPLEPGDQSHLAVGSLRASIAHAMRIVAVFDHDCTGRVPAPYAALLDGKDVILTRAQVHDFVPPSRRPVDLDEHRSWVLVGDDGLVPYVRT